MSVSVGVFSGKGGTGKTSLVASLVRLVGRCVAVDADVDAANLALLLPGEDLDEAPFSSGHKARLDVRACSGCGACVRACPFGALEGRGVPEFTEWACEGCGVCARACPVEAIEMLQPRRGRVWSRRLAEGWLVHAHLGVAQDNSGKLVAEVRLRAQGIAREEAHDWVLVDGPPGVGCPTHAALTGLNRVVVVTEPSASGFHDLERFLDLAAHFAIPAAVVMNKHTLAPRKAEEVARWCEARGALTLGRIPFTPAIPRALARGASPLSVPEARGAIEEIWRRLRTWSGAP